MGKGSDRGKEKRRMDWKIKVKIKGEGKERGRIIQERKNIGGVIVGGRRIKRIRFAGDMALLAEEEMILKEMLLELNDSCEQYGMKINENKTKTMVIGRKIKKVNLRILNEAVEQVDGFKYYRRGLMLNIVYQGVQGLAIQGSVRQIDIIAIKNNSAYIFDPTIIFETHADQSYEVDSERKRIYEPTIPFYKDKYSLSHIDVIGLMVGAPGTIPSFFANKCKNLGLTHSIVKEIAISALKGSVQILRNHLYGSDNGNFKIFQHVETSRGGGFHDAFVTNHNPCSEELTGSRQIHVEAELLHLFRIPRIPSLSFRGSPGLWQLCNVGTRGQDGIVRGVCVGSHKSVSGCSKGHRTALLEIK
ncbi:hypothetical protein ANN_07146 [Periplaneta americana]|uniref:Reverse transcriptase domain-containing protein n=1 Tax=Periplaneta americana TaxID=6978 RepID=A0ABQ8TGU4_PERAM|nr:hypothetical protein ANN_07146 [Periplaneta americana]